MYHIFLLMYHYYFCALRSVNSSRFFSVNINCRIIYVNFDNLRVKTHFVCLCNSSIYIYIIKNLRIILFFAYAPRQYIYYQEFEN